jgi:hypothetical protein
MLGLEDIKNNLELLNMIDWEMTPEEAVTRYLEWGNNWSHGKHFVKSKEDVSHYFVINTWEEPPRIYLIRRNSDEAVELASFLMPEEVLDRFLNAVGSNKGVYGLTEDVKSWLENVLYLN